MNSESAGSTDLSASGLSALDATVGGRPGLDDDLLAGPEWSRHPLDVVRLVLAGLALGVGFAVSVLHPGPARSVSVALVDVVVQLPSWSREALIGSTQIAAVTIPVLMVAILVRSPRMLAMALGSAASAAAAMAVVQHRIEVAVPRRVELASTRGSWLFGAAFPSGAYLAGFAAVAVVMGPKLSRGWRRAAAAALVVASIDRVVTAVAVPLNVAITVAVGAVVGSAALVVFGSPRRRVSRRDVIGTLHRAGFPAAVIDAVPFGAAHGQTFVAETVDGRQAFVKLLGRDTRSADLLFRALRSLRVKNLDDERPSWSPAEIVAHEALAALLAGRSGSAVPVIEAVGSTDGGDGVLAMERIDGRPLDQLSTTEVTDELLDEIWASAAALRDHGIAHRWLTTSHVLVRRPGSGIALVDLRWAALQADDALLAADVASLIVSTSALVGVERGVAAAARSLDRRRLVDALPLIQPLALPADLHGEQIRSLLPEVRQRIQDVTGGGSYELADLERIGPRHLVAAVGLVAVTYTLLGFAANWTNIGHALGSVTATDAAALAILGLAPYVIGAATFLSVVPRRLPFGEVVAVMSAQSFLNRFTPANLGGMALRVRYLQKRGQDLGTAAAAVALSGAASAVGQVLMIGLFAAWAGSDGAVDFSLPRASTLAVLIAGSAAAGGILWVTPLGRRLIRPYLAATLRSVWRTLVELSGQPARFLTLFATTLANKLIVVATFALSCRALDIAISFPRLGFLYLTASSVAAAAPTPGGVGAVEAALTVALTGAGAPPAESLSAVFLFRLATYWLPVPFGWWSLRHLEHTVLT